MTTPSPGTSQGRQLRQIHMPISATTEHSRHISALLNQIKDDGPAIMEGKPSNKATALALRIKSKLPDRKPQASLPKPPAVTAPVSIKKAVSAPVSIKKAGSAPVSIKKAVSAPVSIKNVASQNLRKHVIVTLMMISIVALGSSLWLNYTQQQELQILQAKLQMLTDTRLVSR